MVFNIFFYTLMTLFVIISLFLILLVLIQKGRGGGLASAFGGGGGNTAFGSKTGDVLTWATSVVFGVFLLLAIVLNLMSNTHATTAKAGAPISPPPANTTGGTGTGTTTTDPLTGIPSVNTDLRLPTPLGDQSLPAPTTTRPANP